MCIAYINEGISDFIVNGVGGGLGVIDAIKAKRFRWCGRVIWVDNTALAGARVHENHNLQK